MTESTSSVADAAPAVASEAQERHRIEVERQRLECDKLRAEIADMSTAWWKRPAYVASAIPIMLAFLGFMTAWTSGFFDTQRKQLQAEKAALQADVARLQPLQAEVKELDAQRTQLRRDYDEQRRSMQTQVDDVYLRLKEAIESSGYTLAHFQAFPATQSALPIPTDRALNGDEAAALRRALNEYKLVAELGQSSRADLDSARRSLAMLPASKEAKGVTWHPKDGLRWQNGEPVKFATTQPVR